MLRDARVLVVGAGGIGCPAALALSRTALGHLRLVDPDVVEPSNLPRQVLFAPEDVGLPKAAVAARRLGGSSARVEGVRARLDDTTAGDLLDGVDLLIDATDGARTKDWINQLAVRRGLPYVHAAGLRAEARLLSVPAGGRPCLACLFGRLREETGSCADLGVWNGVVGAIGFLAAEAALARLADPGAPSPGYVVLDFESGRSMVLGASADDDCPVCARAAGVEPFPEGAGCALPGDAAAAPAAPAAGLDLRDVRCPLNLLRARRALADLRAGDVLEIDLGAEGAATVPDGVLALGHEILAREPRGAGLWLRVRVVAEDAAGAADPLDEAALQRFARQIVMPEVGEAGQRALGAASVLVAGGGAAAESARLYLEAAGVGRVDARDDGSIDADGYDLVAWCDGGPPPGDAGAPVVALRAEAGVAGVARALARGALLADAVQRRLVHPARDTGSLVLPR